MNSGSDERLPYRELAEQSARVQRAVNAGTFTRLAAIAPGRSDIRVEMAFALDADRRPRVRGTTTVTVDATCQRCLGRFDRALSLSFDLCIVSDSRLASEVAEAADVVVVDGDTISVPELVEDELLLALPERLCREEPCPYAPSLSYPAEEAPESAPEDNPFHVLSELKR